MIQIVFTTVYEQNSFEPVTGKTTMELVKTDGAHKQFHRGSVQQFEQKFKVRYDTKKSLIVSLKKGWVTGRMPKWWRDFMAKNKGKC